MKRIFADAFFYIAIMNPRDKDHARAVAFGDSLRGNIVTSDFVLLEVADACAKRADRQQFLNLLDFLRSAPGVVIVPLSSKLLEEGSDLYRRRPDKDWPLTDCTSFIIMQQHGIDDVLTADLHFRQAGFDPLLLDQ